MLTQLKENTVSKTQPTKIEVDLVSNTWEDYISQTNNYMQRLSKKLEEKILRNNKRNELVESRFEQVGNMLT